MSRKQKKSRSKIVTIKQWEEDEGEEAEEQRDLECNDRKLRILSRKINMTEEERKLESEKLRIRRLKRQGVMTEEEQKIESEKSRIRRLNRKLSMTEEERKIENQKVRDKRFQQSLRKTEEERKMDLEKGRIATRIARALQTPEEREKRLKRERENKAMRRLKQKQKSKSQSAEIFPNTEQEVSALNSPIIIEATPPILSHGHDNTQEEDAAEVHIKIEMDEVPLDAADLSEFTFQVAEGLVDPQSFFDEENAETNLTLVKEEPNDFLATYFDSSNERDSDEEDEDSYFSASRRPSRVSALKARAKLAKLRVTGGGEDLDGRAERLAKIAKKKRTIQNLNSKYSEEYSHSRSKQTTRNHRNDELMITKLVHEPPEKQIAGIAELIKKKKILLTGETPEQRAARIVEDLKREKGVRKYTGAENAGEKRKRRAEKCLQNLRKRRSLETPEEKAKRKAARATSSREKNRMEREEFRIFQKIISSQNPAQSLEKDEATPELMKRYEFFHSREKKVPDYLQEWRDILNTFFHETRPAYESEEIQNERYAKQNGELRKWLETHEETMKAFLTMRKNRINEYYRNLKNNPKRILSDEEKIAARRKINERKRQRYRKKQEKVGLVINARGERGNVSNNLKPKTERVQRKSRSNGLGQPKRKRSRAGVSPSASVSTNAVFTANNATPQWPSLTLHNAANPNLINPVCRSPRDEYDDDDWIPHCHNDYTPQNSHNQPQSFGSHFLLADTNQHNQQQHSSAFNDELFHRLIHVPPQNHFSSCTPQMSFHHPQTGSSNLIQPSQLQQQVWNPPPRELLDEPLNYSIPLLPNSQNSLMESMQYAPVHSGRKSDIFDAKQTQKIKKPKPRQKAVTNKKLKKPKPQRHQMPKKKIEKPQASRGKRSTATKEIVPIPEATPIVIKLVNTVEISKLRCLHCFVLFKTSAKLDRHIIKCSQTKDNYACKVCNQKYGSRYRLLQHIWGYHRENTRHKCPLCSKEYYQKRRLATHIKTHPSEPNSYIMGSSNYMAAAEKFWCGLCPSAFDTFWSLIIHRRAHQYICTICGIILKNPDHLVEHSLRCHPDINWSSAMYENSHKLIEENQTVGEFNCEKCNSRFSTKQFLALHEALDHPMVEECSYTQTCSSCDMKFRSQKHLDKHFRNCELRSFKCYWCREDFNEEDLRFQHMAQNHSEEKSIPRKLQRGYDVFKCEFCRRSFNSIFCLRSHLRGNHVPIVPENSNSNNASTEVDNVMEKSDSRNTVCGEPLVTSDANIPNPETPAPIAVESMTLSISTDNTLTVVVYPCQICQCNFKTKDFLDKHMSTAHPDTSKHFRVFCDICNKSLALSSQLLRHKKAFHNHASKKMYPCPHCELTLTRPGRLQLHIRLIHENPDPDPKILKINQSRIAKQKTESKFKCDLCNESYKDLHKLTAHKRSVHNIFEVFEFCEVCGQQIIASPKHGQDLRSHMQNCHPEQLSASEPVKSSAVGFGTTQIAHNKLSLPQLLEMIDEIGVKYRHLKGRKKKKPRNKVERKSRKNKTVPESDTEASSESSSDEDWMSEDSSDDETENSEAEIDEGFSQGADTLPVRPPKISIRSLVINPKRSRKTASKAGKDNKARKGRTETMESEPRKRIQHSSDDLKLKVLMPCVVLERCDQLECSLAQTRTIYSECEKQK